MAYTTPKTWTAGEIVTAANMNQQVRDNISFLANPPACRVYNNANISTTSGASALALTFNSERYDTDGMHSTSVNTDRITINTAGLYVITADVWFASNATGRRAAFVNLNGIVTITGLVISATNGDDTDMNLATTYKLAAGDYLQVLVQQNSGGALNVRGVGNVSPEFSATWVGRG